MLVTGLERLLRDAKTGWRGMRRDWGFSVTAVASIALGIAATTAMFSVIHAVIIDPFPYKDVDSLASIRVSEPGQRGGRTYYTVDEYLELRDRTHIFNGVIASTISDVEWTGSGDPQRLRGNHGPFNTFHVMGVPPVIGRAPNKRDAQPGSPAVAVLGYRFWQRQFGGDPNVLGRRMLLNGVSREVIGVMPPRFMWRGADVYLPTEFRRGQAIEGVRFVHVLGRVKPGVTAAQAEADLKPVIEHLKQLEPRSFPDQWRVSLLSFKETFPSDIRSALWILFGATGLLLLIACANVSNLLLSRSASRRLEMTVRASLGAGRWTLLRQLLTESVMLGVTGGIFGIALAYITLRAMISIVPPDTIPDEAQIVMNVPVLVFSAVTSVFVALLFGLAPAWHGWVPNIAEALRSGSRNAGGSRGVLRSGLVIAEVALSVMLLTGAAMMMRTLFRLQGIDLGFPTDRVLTMRIPLAEKRYPEPARRVAFFNDLLPRISALPGVTAAGINSGVHPFGGWGVRVQIPGAAEDQRRVGLNQIDPGYLRVFNIRLMSGRPLTDQDIATKQQVALVNQAFVNRYLNDRRPLGAAIRIPQLQRPPASLSNPEFQIVGVTGDMMNDDPKQGVQPELFIPHTIIAAADTLSIRAAGAPEMLIRPASAQVYALDKNQPVMEVRTIEEMLRRWVLAGPRFNVILFGVFAALGLTLATVGVFGVLSTIVAQRTAEIGVRMAMGATVRNVVSLVLRRALFLIAAGLFAGMLITIAAGRLLSANMQGLAEFDVGAFSAVCLVLLAAGCIASFRPVHRAARVDPAQALRNE